MIRLNHILEYWQAIERGQCVVSARIRKQYAALVEQINNPRGDYIFDEKRAEKPIAFIETLCRHSKGEWAGKPVILELFQKAFISALFGFIDKNTGLRQYREALLYVARKNGKSTLLAGIALYMLILDGEPGAEVYSVATKKDQAKVIFDETHNMVKQSAVMGKLMKKRKTDLYCDLTFSKFQPLGKNSDTLDGLNAHCVIMDELHGIKDRNLYEVMKQSQSARRQPLLIMITTAGTVRECIFDDMYDHACKVVDGSLEDRRFLPLLYELDRREEWADPACWQKANPALGTIKKLDVLQDGIQKAKNSPNDLSGLLVKDFNIRDTVNSAWLSFEDIDNVEIFDLARFRKYHAIGGVDLSIAGDLTCATLLMMERESQKRFVTQMYWLPREGIEKRVKVDKIPYDKWVQRGLMRLCEGNTIKYSDVTAWFVEMANQYQIYPAWVYYDRYNAGYWADEMKEQGFTVVPCAQGAKTLSNPMKLLGADLQAKRINYNNNPILKWCLSNTSIETDRNGNIVPVKAQTAKHRIDGTASLLDAYVGLLDHFNEYVRVLPKEGAGGEAKG